MITLLKTTNKNNWMIYIIDVELRLKELNYSLKIKRKKNWTNSKGVGE